MGRPALLERTIDAVEFDDDMAGDYVAESGVDIRPTEEAVLNLLRALGEAPEREGLRNTPKRVARMYTELPSGYHADPEKVVHDDALLNIANDQLVIMRDIGFYSLCEHHMLPSIGRAPCCVCARREGHRSLEDPPCRRYDRTAPAGQGVHDPPDRRRAAAIA